jgi:hypothetical protein
MGECNQLPCIAAIVEDPLDNACNDGGAGVYQTATAGASGCQPLVLTFTFTAIQVGPPGRLCFINEFADTVTVTA